MSNKFSPPELDEAGRVRWKAFWTAQLGARSAKEVALGIAEELGLSWETVKPELSRLGKADPAVIRRWFGDAAKSVALATALGTSLPALIEAIEAAASGDDDVTRARSPLDVYFGELVSTPRVAISLACAVQAEKPAHWPRARRSGRELSVDAVCEKIRKQLASDSPVRVHVACDTGSLGEGRFVADQIEAWLVRSDDTEQTRVRVEPSRSMEGDEWVVEVSQAGRPHPPCPGAPAPSRRPEVWLWTTPLTVVQVSELATGIAADPATSPEARGRLRRYAQRLRSEPALVGLSSDSDAVVEWLRGVADEGVPGSVGEARARWRLRRWAQARRQVGEQLTLSADQWGELWGRWLCEAGPGGGRSLPYEDAARILASMEVTAPERAELKRLLDMAFGAESRRAQQLVQVARDVLGRATGPALIDAFVASDLCYRIPSTGALWLSPELAAAWTAPYLTQHPAELLGEGAWERLADPRWSFLVREIAIEGAAIAALDRALDDAPPWAAVEVAQTRVLLAAFSEDARQRGRDRLVQAWHTTLRCALDPPYEFLIARPRYTEERRRRELVEDALRSLSYRLAGELPRLDSSDPVRELEESVPAWIVQTVAAWTRRRAEGPPLYRQHQGPWDSSDPRFDHLLDLAPMQLIAHFRAERNGWIWLPANLEALQAALESLADSGDALARSLLVRPDEQTDKPRGGRRPRSSPWAAVWRLLSKKARLRFLALRPDEQSAEVVDEMLLPVLEGCKSVEDFESVHPLLVQVIRRLPAEEQTRWFDRRLEEHFRGTPGLLCCETGTMSRVILPLAVALEEKTALQMAARRYEEMFTQPLRLPRRQVVHIAPQSTPYSAHQPCVLAEGDRFPTRDAEPRLHELDAELAEVALALARLGDFQTLTRRYREGLRWVLSPQHLAELSWSLAIRRAFATLPSLGPEDQPIVEQCEATLREVLDPGLSSLSRVRLLPGPEGARWATWAAWALATDPVERERYRNRAPGWWVLCPLFEQGDVTNRGNSSAESTRAQSIVAVTLAIRLECPEPPKDPLAAWVIHRWGEPDDAARDPMQVLGMRDYESSQREAAAQALLDLGRDEPLQDWIAAEGPADGEVPCHLHPVGHHLYKDAETLQRAWRLGQDSPRRDWLLQRGVRGCRSETGERWLAPWAVDAYAQSEGSIPSERVWCELMLHRAHPSLGPLLRRLFGEAPPRTRQRLLLAVLLHERGEADPSGGAAAELRYWIHEDPDPWSGPPHFERREGRWCGGWGVVMRHYLSDSPPRGLEDAGGVGAKRLWRALGAKTAPPAQEVAAADLADGDWLRYCHPANSWAESVSARADLLDALALRIQKETGELPAEVGPPADGGRWAGSDRALWMQHSAPAERLERVRSRGCGWAEAGWSLLREGERLDEVADVMEAWLQGGVALQMEHPSDAVALLGECSPDRLLRLLDRGAPGLEVIGDDLPRLVREVIEARPDATGLVRWLRKTACAGA